MSKKEIMSTVWLILLVAGVGTGEMVWGTATAAYQVEGYRESDGRQPSIWDAFDTANTSSYIQSVRPDGEARVYQSESGAVADEDYSRYEESVDLIDSFGFQGVRMSISWPRVVSYNSEGTNFTANLAGLSHYRNVLQAYAAKNIQVALTLWHWDLPLALEERAARDRCSSAWLCADWLPSEFGKYANLVLSELPTVAYYITLNEPMTIIQNGYSGTGAHAPGRCSNRETCYAGNDSLEPYAATKTLLLAHGHIFQAWNQAGRPGIGCGLTLNGDFCVAFTESPEDQAAATRCLEWQLPLFFDPIFYGHWPVSVDAVVGPRFIAEDANNTSYFTNTSWAWTTEELGLVHGAHDNRHLFMNTYTSRYVRALTPDDSCYNTQSYDCDANASVSGYNFTDGTPIGTPSTNGWLYNYGSGIRHLLKFYDDRYPNRTYIITENGWGNASQATLELEVKDLERCNFYRDYISNVSAAAVIDQIDIAAYFAWSLIDNFEWADGYSTRFGMVYVNYTDQSRSAKHSALYFQKFITKATSLNQTLELPSCDSF